MDRDELDVRINHATDSALGRFIYKFVVPGAFILLGSLLARSINALDAAMDKLQAASEQQSTTQVVIQGEVRAIRSQMDFQNKYQTLVDQQQDAELARHARALNMK